MPSERRPRSLAIARAHVRLLAGLVLWLIGWAFPASAQTWQVSNWHVDDGLPSGEITALAQTPEGYLWVGTPSGLARFDGAKFKVFRGNETPGLLDSRISALLAARDGTLWVGTLGGTLARLREGRFETLTTPLPVDQDLQRAPGSWSWGRSSQLVEDERGGIWWHLRGKGVVRFHQGQWRRYEKADHLPDSIWQLVRDHEGAVWAEGNGDLLRFDGEQWRPSGTPMIRGAEMHLTPASHGGMWLSAASGTGTQIRRIDRSVRQESAFQVVSSASSSEGNIGCLLEDRQGRLWAGMKNGGLCWLEDQGKWQSLEHQGALERPWVTCMMEDRQGNLWAGTAENGLFRVIPQPVSMRPAVEAPESVFAVCAAKDGTAWIGTRSSGVFHNSLQGWASVEGDWGNQVPKISNFLADSHGGLWVATSSGLFRWNGDRFQRAAVPFPANLDVTVLIEGKAGSLWVGGQQSLICWQGDRIETYQIRGEVRSLAEDESGAVWIGTVGGGLFRLSADQPRRLEKVAGYPASDATIVYIDTRNTLWVGSWGAGLFRHRMGRFEDLTPRSLPAGRLVDILNDRNGMMWVSSTNGIFCISNAVLDSYEPGKSPALLWRHFSLEQGLSNRYCSGSSATVDGKLWFPVMEQIAVIDPAAAAAGLTPASIRLEGMVADNRELPVIPGKKLSVSTATRRLEFRYTALDLTNPSSTLFRYKLEGMDADWVDADGARAAAYSKLPAGDYQFRVMAGGADGRWREAAEAANLLVAPQWWELTWLRWLSGITAVGLFTGGLVWRQSRNARRKLQEILMARQLDSERARIARDIHDEMGANLTYITQLSDLARGPAGDGNELDRIHETSRELTRTMDEIVWAVDPGHDTLDSLVNYLSRTASNYLRAAGVRCRLDLPLEIPDIRVTSQVRHHLFLVFKEALNNVVKHASASEARLALELAPDSFLLVLQDNGVGFDASEESPSPTPSEHRISGGRGLVNMSERLERIGGALIIESQPGHGTRLAIRVPVLP